MKAVIGGTGLTELEGLSIESRQWFETVYGEPSSQLVFGHFQGQDIIFLARHGSPHQIPPHKINYRANLSALQQAGVTEVIAVNAVGGIHPELGPACIAVPDQVIDYTYGREHTIYDGKQNALDHVDFTFPYTESLRQALLASAASQGIQALDGGVYGATQGPRLETSAEIRRMQSDGCDMVGMTGMPEASLAREFEMDYACLALSVNWCAGLTESIITMQEIEEAVATGMGKVRQILAGVLA